MSYFDEGVSGNCGWDSYNAIGSAGCVRFDSDAAPRFRYDHQAAGTERILDTYAMNYAGEDELWLYFDDEFPIVQIHDGEYHVYSCGAAGARALAVDGDRALLLGDYEDPDLIRIFRLDGKRAQLEARMALVDECGAPIGQAQAFGVGRELYLRRGRALLSVQW